MRTEVKTCPVCGVYQRGRSFCHRDGEALVETDGIVERYRILDWVGEGAMGVVYRAQHMLLDNRIVALKMLYRQHGRDQMLVDRFFREAQAASRVDNPHIVQVMDSGTTAEHDAFLVMEFLAGLNLRQVIDEQAPLDVGRALDLGFQIAEGLHAAHQSNIIHRDLKPGNIVLVPTGAGQAEFVKLLDFGIALLGDHPDGRLTSAGMILGTPAYMSPEQASGKPVDVRTDIYSLGILLHEMLSGRCPFPDGTAHELLLARITQQPERLGAHRPDISDEVESLVLRMLAASPAGRPASMQEAAGLLREVRDREDVREFIPSGAVRSGDRRGQRAWFLRAIGAVRARVAEQSSAVLTFGSFAMGLLFGVLLTLLLVGGGGSRAVSKRHEAAGSSTSVTDAGVAISTGTDGSQRQLSTTATAHRRPRSSRASRVARRERSRSPHRPSPAAHARRPSRKPTAPESRRAGSGAHASTWVMLVSSPLGADVVDGTRKLGTTPLRVSTDEARTLSVYREGYRSIMVDIPEGATGTVTRRMHQRTMSWDVRSLRQLKQMHERGEISKFTYRRRRAALIKERDAKLRQLETQREAGKTSDEHYKQQADAVKSAYR